MFLALCTANAEFGTLRDMLFDRPSMDERPRDMISDLWTVHIVLNHVIRGLRKIALGARNHQIKPEVERLKEQVRQLHEQLLAYRQLLEEERREEGVEIRKRIEEAESQLSLEQVEVAFAKLVVRAGAITLVVNKPAEIFLSSGRGR